MKFTEFFSGQRILRQILNWLEEAKIEAISERITDFYDDGILQGELNNFSIVGYVDEPSLADHFHVAVRTGVAYMKGERIALLDNPLLTYDATLPSHTTDNGLGVQVPTPQSTGSFNIPLTTGSINYLYIAYLLTTDDSAYSLHKLTDEKFFYKRTDGYEIQVNTTGVNPDSSRFLFLGTVNLTGLNEAAPGNISIQNRAVGRVSLNRVKIQTNSVGNTDRPATYIGGTAGGGQHEYFLDDHIKAVGTGIISPTNPHAITLTDLGVTPNQTVEAHRKLEHVNGIIAGTYLNPAPQGSGLFCQRIQITQPNDDYILVRALVLGEAAIVYGIAYDYTNFPSDTIVSFTGSLTGTYYIYVDVATATLQKTLVNILSDPTKLPLCQIFWDANGKFPAPGGTLGVPIDLRQFGTFDRLERWNNFARPTNPMPGAFGYNTDLNLLEFWNGSVWVQPGSSLSAISSVPTGSVFSFAGPSAPLGYVFCDGTALSRTTYANLYSVIGITWGPGDGSTTFNVPDLRGRSIVGAGTGPGLSARTLGATGGAENHDHSHSHAFSSSGSTGAAGSHSHGGGTNYPSQIEPVSGHQDWMFGNYQGSGSHFHYYPHYHGISTDGNHTHSLSASGTTANDATSASSFSPYGVCNHIIKT